VTPPIASERIGRTAFFRFLLELRTREADFAADDLFHMKGDVLDDFADGSFFCE